MEIVKSPSLTSHAGDDAVLEQSAPKAVVAAFKPSVTIVNNPATLDPPAAAQGRP